MHRKTKKKGSCFLFSKVDERLLIIFIHLTFMVISTQYRLMYLCLTSTGNLFWSVLQTQRFIPIPSKILTYFHRPLARVFYADGSIYVKCSVNRKLHFKISSHHFPGVEEEIYLQNIQRLRFALGIFSCLKYLERHMPGTQLMLNDKGTKKYQTTINKVIFKISIFKSPN